jgi:LacI family transcriptional regulator
MAGRSQCVPPSVVRLEDVARLAGVSIATASRSIHGASGRVVAGHLRERVLAAAAELGYVPNVNAQAMARGRADIIGLVVHDIADPYFSTIASGVAAVAASRGALVTLAVTDRDPERELAHVQLFRRNRCRALILVGSRATGRRVAAALTRELTAFQAEGGRAAAVSQPKLPIDTVAADNLGGALELASSLVRLGYRQFGMLSGPAGLLAAADRAEGFTRGLAEHGVAPLLDDIVHSDFNRDGGYDGMGELLDAGRRVECVFAVNDVMAVGAMACLRDRGLRVPDDVAVAGFDDIPTLRDITPALTTVRLPLTDIGAAAAAMVLAPSSDKARVERVAATVVVRASTPGLANRDGTTSRHRADLRRR